MAKKLSLAISIAIALALGFAVAGCTASNARGAGAGASVFSGSWLDGAGREFTFDERTWEMRDGGGPLMRGTYAYGESVIVMIVTHVIRAYRGDGWMTREEARALAIAETGVDEILNDPDFAGEHAAEVYAGALLAFIDRMLDEELFTERAGTYSAGGGALTLVFDGETIILTRH